MAVFYCLDIFLRIGVMQKNDVKATISSTWEQVIAEINKCPKKFPSEKTLVFRFAWLLQKRLEQDTFFEFEKIVLKEGLTKSKKFLDLYFESNGLKIGMEFKFPKKSENSSNNQTQRRMTAISDLERLNAMVVNKEIDLGIFLFSTDLKAYAYDTGKRVKSKDYKIHNGFVFNKSEFLPPYEKAKTPLVCDISFDWVGLEKIKPNDVFAYIKPIFINH